MKFLFVIMAVLALIFFSPPILKKMNSSQIHGSTSQQVIKSARDVRRNMPSRERTIFDTAFGLLEKFKSDEAPDAFAKLVSGLEPEQVIALAKQEVEDRIKRGEPDFKQYTSWEDMLDKKLAEDAPKKSGAGQQPAPLRQSERTPRPTN